MTDFDPTPPSRGSTQHTRHEGVRRPGKFRARVEAERRAQGLPPQITDPATIARVAALLRAPAPGTPNNATPPEGTSGGRE